MKTSKIKRLVVNVPQGDAGNLVKESRFSFNYTVAERACEVSLLMPIRAESYAETALPAVFAMNRPEGFLLDKLRERFGKFVALDDMRLLALTGQNQIGRLRYREPDDVNAPMKIEVGLGTLLKSGGSDTLFDFLVEVYLHSGISGFQPKVMLPDADAIVKRDDVTVGIGAPVTERSTAVTPDLIVKSAGDDYPHLAQNEFLCMEAARLAGIRVPDFWLSDDGSLFVMRRFDLEGSAQRQLGFEDMAALTLRSAYEKYEGSYSDIATTVALYCRENRADSLARLFEYVALSVMVRNGDAHLKNFGLLYDHPHGQAPALSPLYDVVTTSVYPIVDLQSGRALTDRTPALKLHREKSKHYPDRKALHDFGRNICLVMRPERVVERIATAMKQALDLHRDRIDADLHAAMSAEWEAGMSSVGPDRVFARAEITVPRADGKNIK
ncbi:MAG: type II toxin-antitoxin system HipA family toxin [Janthinobacterium lividum]